MRKKKKRKSLRNLMRRMKRKKIQLGHLKRRKVCSIIRIIN